MAAERASPEFWRDGSLGDAHRVPRLLFGHVREDIDVELALAKSLRGLDRAMVVTSGGCLALAIRALAGEEVCSVDINPAQNYLAELKSDLVSRLDSLDDLRRLHESSAVEAWRDAELSPAAMHYWETHSSLLKVGLHRCGWIDVQLGRLRIVFHWLIHSRKTVVKFLAQDSITEQESLYDTKWNSFRWRSALAIAFRPTILRAILKSGRIEIPADLPDLVQTRLHAMLTRSPARANRAAYELFLGEFPPNGEDGPPHLRKTLWKSIRASQAQLRFQTEDVAHWLSTQSAASLDFIAISNILEQSKPDYRRWLQLELARVLRPEGILVARSILPDPLFNKIRGFSRIDDSDYPEDRSGICNQVYAFRREG